MAAQAKPVKQHSEAWFERKEKQLLEPFKNTLRYYRLELLRIWKLPLAIYQLSKVHDEINDYKEQCENYLRSARAINVCGQPGVGKTFSAANIAIEIAAQRWEELQGDYHLQKLMLNRWISLGDTEKVEAFRDLEASYLFYKAREDEHIPCLVSSIPLVDLDGRTSYVLTDEVALQEIRVPEYTVIFNDESGSSQGADISKNAPIIMKWFYRYNRHFGDFILINTDQSNDGNAKFIRSVTDYNIRLSRQRTVYGPERAQERYEKRRAKFLEKCAAGKYSAERAQRIGEELYYKGLILKTIGFREIPFRFEALDGTFVPDAAGKYIFPRRGMVQYNDRAYRKLYQARGKNIELEAWDSLLAGDEDKPDRIGEVIKKNQKQKKKAS